jgi:hypothetical protein
MSIKEHIKKRWDKKNIIFFIIIYFGIFLYLIVKIFFFTGSIHSPYPTKGLGWDELVLQMPSYSLYALFLTIIMKVVMGPIK